MSLHIQEAPNQPARTPEALVWTRDDAIRRLRDRLQKLTDEGHSMCQVAADKRIFCRGFRRWHDAEFHKKWKSAIGSSTHLDRSQMEEFANFWQIVEQTRLGVGFACDAQTLSHGACRGWDEFGNDQLARYCGELLQVNVRVVGEFKEKSRIPPTADRRGGQRPRTL